MKRLFNQESVAVTTHFFHASLVIVGVVTLLCFRLWWVQVYRGEYYESRSESNRIRKIDVPAPRGMIFDRKGDLVLGNRAFFDLTYTPQFVRDQDATLQTLAKLLHGSVTSFETRLRRVRGQPGFLPVILRRNLTLHEASVVESARILLPGIDVSMAPRRDYSGNVSAHMTGYLGEVDPQALVTLNRKDPDNPYRMGDLIGKSGLEYRYERELRGKRGFKLIQIDAYGRQTDSLPEIRLPSRPASPGNDLILTIDQELQATAVEAFRGKQGAVIAIDARDGQVLALLSSPGFDPTIFQERISVEQWRELSLDMTHPLLDKTTGGEFAPGSTYKAIVAMAALQEGVVTADRRFTCNGAITIGNQTYHCHAREGHGSVDLAAAIYKSCDVYFYQVGNMLGPDRIADYAARFGLGRKLDFDLNMERAGLVPSTAWKRSTLGAEWLGGETPPIAIGQGYNLITPLQLANLYATIGNGGKIHRPWLVQKVMSPLGKVIEQFQPELIGEVRGIAPETWNAVKSALQDVVHHENGTGQRAAVPGVTVAGKTGSVQVARLRKGLKAAEIALKLREHALFAAFSPVDSPEIAVAVVSEHDDVGGGGAQAAPVAGAVLRKYWEIKARQSGLATGQPPKETDGVQLPKTP